MPFGLPRHFIPRNDGTKRDFYDEKIDSRPPRDELSTKGYHSRGNDEKNTYISHAPRETILSRHCVQTVFLLKGDYARSLVF
jgi:hypothetical protein